MLPSIRRLLRSGSPGRSLRRRGADRKRWKAAILRDTGNFSSAGCRIGLCWHTAGRGVLGARTKKPEPFWLRLPPACGYPVRVKAERESRILVSIRSRLGERGARRLGRFQSLRPVQTRSALVSSIDRHYESQRHGCRCSLGWGVSQRARGSGARWPTRCASANAVQVHNTPLFTGDFLSPTGVCGYTCAPVLPRFYAQRRSRLK
jgi:hypothetical protein